MKAQQAIDHTSLGIVRPKQIVQVHVDTLSPDERRTMWQRYKELRDQLSLEFDEGNREVKALSPPDYKFQIRFRCDDPACTLLHKFGILDWEIDALYFAQKLKHHEMTAKTNVVKHLEKHLMAPDRDPWFFLGNISTHPQNFTIVGLWYAKKSPPTLFDAEDSPRSDVSS